MSEPNRFALFLFAHPGAPAADADRIAAGLPALPGLSHAHLYTPAAATDPFLDDGAPPALALELAFERIEALEDALRRPLAALLDPAGWTHQAMLLRSYAVPEPRSAATSCTYVVAYEGEAADNNAWLSHYLLHHPPLMVRFPALRGLAVATRIDWCSPPGWIRANALQRNRVVFDDPAALDAALASPVRREMRADFHALPPFEGRVTHFAMQTRTVGPAR